MRHALASTQPTRTHAGNPARRLHFHLRMRPLALSLACIGAAPLPVLAQSFPTGGNVVRGLATINPAVGNTMAIDQLSGRAIIDWNAFSVGAGNTLNIRQQMGAGSVLLNRVVNNGPRSDILGTINAPGHVFIVNPAGVLFGAGSQVNVGGLVASTLDISNDSLMPAGKDNTLLGKGDALVFTRPESAASNAAGITVESGARITAAPGGTVALMGATVSNAGEINVARGSLGLLSGRVATIDYEGDGLTTFKVSGEAADIATKGLVVNSGVLTADGGRVQIAAVSSEAKALVVNQSGIVRARSLESRNGQILLGASGSDSAEMRIAGTLDASGTASNANGGAIAAQAPMLRLDGAQLDASGAKGGTVLLNAADALSVAPSSAVHADASMGDGKGGTLFAVGNNATHIAGTWTAKGSGAGAGGTIATGGATIEVGQDTSVDASGGVQGANGRWLVSSTGDLTVAHSVPAYRADGYDTTTMRTRVSDDALGRALGNGTDVNLASAAVAAEGRSDGKGVVFEAGSELRKTGVRASTLHVDSKQGIFMDGAAIRSTGGALGVEFDADSAGTTLPATQQTDASPAASRGGVIDLAASAIETAGGNIAFYGQGDKTQGRAVGIGARGGAVSVVDSTLSTCAAGVASCSSAGDISLRGEGATVRVNDTLGVSSAGVALQGARIVAGNGRIDIDGRGGFGSTGVLVGSSTGATPQASSIATASGDARITGVSRSYTDGAVFATLGTAIDGKATIGAGTGVALVGANVAIGGNLDIVGSGGDMAGVAGSAAVAKAALANGQSSFSAGNGVALSAADVSVGPGKHLSVSGNAGSRALLFGADGTVTPSTTDAFGIAMAGTQGRGLRAEGGAIVLDAGSSDVGLLSTAPDPGAGSDGPSRMLSTASSTGAGGSIAVSGRNVWIDGIGGGVARLDSSGVGQAGTVSVRANGVDNGDGTDGGVIALGSGARIDANAVSPIGNGGKVEVIASDSFRAYASINARGGSAGGDGGQVETSAQRFEMSGLHVDASAPMGKAGMWTLDPSDVYIVHGAASGSLAGNPFTPVTTSKVQDGDISATLSKGTSVSINTGIGQDTGNILLGSGVVIERSAATTNAVTLQLDAAHSIVPGDPPLVGVGVPPPPYVPTIIRAVDGAGPLNVDFKAGANPSPSDINFNGTIQTQGGSVTMAIGAGTTPLRATLSTVAGTSIDTRVLRSDANAGGAVDLRGGLVLLNGTTIQTSSGNVGVVAGNGDGYYTAIDGAGIAGAGIRTTSGNVLVEGRHVNRFNASGNYSTSAGVVINSATLQTASGNIAVHGYGGEAGGSARVGVQIGDGALLATTAGGNIEVTGTASGRSAGVLIGVDPTTGKPAAVAPRIASTGNVVLRAANNPGAAAATDGFVTGDAMVVNGSVAASGVVDLRPGGFSATGVLGNDTGVPITLGGTGVDGFSLSSAELALLSASDVVIGSNTHAADIQVAAPVSMAGGLTLQNGGGGNLRVDGALSASRVGLVSAGSITQAANAPITAGTLVALSSGGDVVLRNAANNVGTVGGGAAGSFAFVDAGAVKVGGATVAGFDAVANAPQPVVANSMAAQSVFVRTLAGDLSLGGNVTGSASTDLVAAQRFQNPGGFTITGAPFRVWADTWVGETRGGLTGSGRLPNLYHCAYLGLCSVDVSATDNHFIYAQQPVATVGFGNYARLFGRPNPLLGYTVSGLILGDTGAGIMGTAATTATPTSLPGRYPVSGSFTSAEGYALDVVPGSLLVTQLGALPKPDVLRDVPNTYTFDRNLGAPPICYATGPLGGDRAPQGDDVLAREWSKVRTRPNLTSCVDTDRKNGCADF